jgi:hypothetical protein
MRLIEFRPLSKNTLRGFAVLELPSGLVVRDVSIHQKGEKCWAGLPSRPMVGSDDKVIRNHAGKVQYAAMLGWRDRGLADRFSAAVVDEAIRRRFHLVPFVVTIAEPDENLPEKLRPEWPGILQWAIDGCLEWQRVGLNPPVAVPQATEAYLSDEDAIAIWLDERCGVDKIYRERSSTLFSSWKLWAEGAGEYVGSQKRFTQALEDRGFIRDRNAEGQVIFRGLVLRYPASD